MRLSFKGFRTCTWYPGLTSGLMMTLSFPNPGLSWIAWIALIPLMTSLGTLKPKQAFSAGMACGMVHYLTLVYWIVPTIHHYGGLPLALAVPVLVLLCLYLSIYTGCFCMIFSTMTPSAFMPLKAAALWTGLEFLRAFVLTGFPWGLAGYSQFLNLNLIQLADITGVYGISFLIVLTNSTVALLWSIRGKNQRKALPLTPKIYVTATLILILSVGSVLQYGRQRMLSVKQNIATARTSRISVVQGNIDQALKWDPKFQDATIDTYCNLSRSQFPGNPDLIVWPETALPFYYSWDTSLSNTVDTCVRQGRTDFLFGSPAFEGDTSDYKIFNRAYLVNRFALVTGTYDKIHLVPFGEYVPLGKYLKFLGKITEQAGDFSPGPEHSPPLKSKNASIGVLICFEIIFAPLARNHAAKGADILITMTNDAWFGLTSAPLQHFSMAVFRAIENRRSVARSANTGISGFIDPTGKILETTDLYTATALTENLPCLTIPSIYTTVGDVFALACFGIASLACLGDYFRARRTKQNT